MFLPRVPFFELGSYLRERQIFVRVLKEKVHFHHVNLVRY